MSGALPLLHRPRFYAQYISGQGQDGERYQRLPLESGFILNGVLSLSARFSPSLYFASIPPKERGEHFAKQAQSIYAETATSQNEKSQTLEYLQGCLLLAFYHQTMGPSSFGWMLTGVCTRLAYDLGINTIDEDVCSQLDLDTPQWNSAEDWVLREELRRAWWCVWELDTFASTMSRRPYTIDRNLMQVLLPSSDEQWFAGEPVASAPMGTTCLTAWKSLQGSPNQDERAWFLVANFLMGLACDLAAQKEVSRQAKADMESALSCYALSLPERFRLTSNTLVFNDETFRASNWVIATNIILQRCV